MHAQVRRSITLAAAGSLALGALVSTAPAQVAAASTCRPTTTILSRTPVSSFALPGGASVRIWDTGNLANDLNELRISVVTIPRGTLTPGVTAAPTLARAVTPAAMIARDPRAVVAINGGHFDPSIPGIPEKSQITNSTIRKAMSTTAQHLVVYAKTKVVQFADTRLGGQARTTRGTWGIAAVNWQSLRAGGINLFSSAWGTRAHPVGPITVVVVGGKVTRILRGSAGSGRPAATAWYLTAPSGTFSTALGKLRIGDRVTLTTWSSGIWLHDGKWPHTTVGAPSGLVGTGGTLVLDRRNIRTCGARDEQLRPRSAVVWKANGDMLVVAVSGRATVSGTRFGGATVHQFADYLRQLGAVLAVNLDGGTSTTLLVRRTVGGPLVRLDRSNSEYQRPVVDALVFRTF